MVVRCLVGARLSSYPGQYPKRVRRILQVRELQLVCRIRRPRPCRMAIFTSILLLYGRLMRPCAQVAEGMKAAFVGSRGRQGR